jgi:hypothetical protein
MRLALFGSFVLAPADEEEKAELEVGDSCRDLADLATVAASFSE